MTARDAATTEDAMEPRANDGNMWRVARCRRCRVWGVIGYYTRKKGFGRAANRIDVDGWTHICERCSLAQFMAYLTTDRKDEDDYEAERRWVDEGGSWHQPMDGPH